MNTEQIRNAYLKFFEERGHAVVSRAPLVLKDDPTTLFTGSGMQPMIPYLLGQPHPDGQRIVDSQTCLRAQDIDDIGDNRHTTFFEMLGNWSMGDYFKQQQIEWMFEFLSEVVELDVSKLYVTCYAGNEELGIAKDTEAAEVWRRLFDAKGLSSGEAEIGSEEAGYARGMQDGERIFYYDGSKNWWSRNGNEHNTPVGDPCGPDSEMFYDFGTEHDTSFGEYCHPNCDCGRFMEIGNNVFMAYKKVGEGKFEALERPNVDHGSGLERIAAAKLGNPDVFRISLMWPIIEKLQTLSGKKYESHTESMRVIADHLRAATFLAVDGCVPSNKEQGYVMRRLLRRAIRFSFDLGIEQNFLQEIVPVIADLYENDFPEVKSNRDTIITVLVKEEKAFRQTLRKGLLQFNRGILITGNINTETGETSSTAEEMNPTGTGEFFFKLYDTYGFPVELSLEEAYKQGIEVPADWREQFDARMEEQRNRSRTAGKGEFKGGLGGDTLQHRKYHTATHLLQSALREVIGPVFQQHGSNITEERLRFDFNFDRKVTREELDRAEELVNGWIAEDLPVSYKMYPTREALDMGAIGPFGERYDAEVKVYQMGEGDHIASLEICGGPHVDNTGILAEGGKKFKITKEESSSAGIRRIKAILV
ncbi:alanine--tRNA ligase [Candidatus Mycosynbacter amalyticus]|uniref:alanine--tRNA ligase n=1 Tax=Candidatus Mycosynbacter amalyticus TaxID=2665156 RepID=A0A857MKE6_9BACT|nr:alanine--tRNA ligase [Candidatus Mycosynbacter amalyticus]QHN43064.1 alanine--tRNA ligase [Candidatus Mycosynbacter amalyticus]